MYEPATPVDRDNITLFTRDERGAKTTPVYVFGYAPTTKDLLDLANRHALDVDQDDKYRVQSARRYIFALLSDVLCGRVAAVPVVPEDEWGPYSPCTVLATNLNEKEMSLASHKELIELMQEAFGTQEEPKWYKLPRRDFLSLRS